MCFELQFCWWSRLVSNQRPSACEAVEPTTENRLRCSVACRLAELDPSEYLFRKFGPILAL